MLKYLEQLLKDKTDKIGKRGELLYAKWQLEKEYATQVLATIFNIFPHYTLHDRTHSEEILKNVGEILDKETFKLFSLTDLWLLLYAAFYHDMGMAVFAPDLDKILKCEDFILYLKDIQADSKHALYTQSSYFEISDNKIVWKDNEVSLEKMEAFKFIMAEYIRSSHGKRIENVFENDPLTSLVPLRLRSMLEKICECHTESFEKVMELPDKENGLDDEHCHPRFIACLLRLGDLLDLDNNRVSDIILRTVKTIPTESFFHIQKHLSISHLNINSKQIDITANCEDYKTADLSSKWFFWIDQEITNQMKNWNQIVPNLEFGFLPTVGNLRVELKEYDSIDGKVHPKFEIDSQKAIEMLQGTGLYSEPYQSIREILQNSEDATYLRIWIENKDSNMTREEFLKECREKYAIKVTMDGEFSDDKNIWHITISDAGVGMSKEDLQFLYKIGSSSHNKERQRYLSEMPEWMKPSGTFGIGFQSIFLLTDKVHIRTRKYNSGDVYDIDLYNPTGDDNGTILLKTTKNSYFRIGTEVSFDLVAKKVPEYIDYSGNGEITGGVVSDYDFIESEYLDFEIGKISDEILKFSTASYLTIKLNINSNDEELNLEPEVTFQYYSKKTNLAISIDSDENKIIRSNECDVFYRNQPVRIFPFNFCFLKISVNICGGNAKDILTLNRNEINSQYRETLYKDTISTVIEYLLKGKFSEMSSNQKPLASAFVYVYGNTVGIENDHSEIFTKWMEYAVDVMIKGEYKEKRLADLLSEVNSVNIVEDMSNRRSYELEDGSLTIFNLKIFPGGERKLLNKALSQYFKSISYLEKDRYVVHKQDDLPLIDKNGWKSWFREVYLNNLIARGHIPCNPDYVKLVIKDDYIFPYPLYTPYPMDFYYPKMVSPYVIKRSGENEIEKRLEVYVPDKLIDFVFENRKDENVTKDEIRATYEKFIKDMESVINEINEESNPSKKTE